MSGVQFWPSATNASTPTDLRWHLAASRLRSQHKGQPCLKARLYPSEAQGRPSLSLFRFKVHTSFEVPP